MICCIVWETNVELIRSLFMLVRVLAIFVGLVSELYLRSKKIKNIIQDIFPFDAVAFNNIFYIQFPVYSDDK